MMPQSQVHAKSPPVPIPLDHASSLAELEGLPRFFFVLAAPFFPLGRAESGPARAGLTGGVWRGSTQEKEQRFLRIFVTGLGERALQRSSR